MVAAELAEGKLIYRTINTKTNSNIRIFYLHVYLFKLSRRRCIIMIHASAAQTSMSERKEAFAAIMQTFPDT